VKEQAVPQSIPAGLLVMVPVPFPVLATERLNVFKLNVAVAVLTASIVTAHVPVPVQAPDQPVKFESAEGLAVRVTTVPLLKAAEQVVPQLMPAGEEVTVPLSDPLFVTVKAKVWRVKEALTVFAAFRVTVQEVPEVLVHPVQPVKIELAAGVAVRVTELLILNGAEQVAPQSIPAGEEVTVPVPVPDFVTDKVTGG